MPTQYGSFLRSYDFFGKAIPGIVLLSGTIPLFESVPELSISTQQGTNITLAAVIIIALVFVGLIVGQFVHTIAVNVERTLYWAGHTISNFFYEHVADLIYPSFSDERLLGGILSKTRCKQVWRSIRPWVARRYWGTLDVFKGHRRLFENSLGWHFDKEVNKRHSDEENLVYHGFRAAFDNNFEIGEYEDLADFGIESPKYTEFSQLYPLVASEVTKQNGGRATQFQSIYSFCRGMWVVLTILLATYIFVFIVVIDVEPIVVRTPVFDIYSMVILIPSHSDYSPVLLDLPFYPYYLFTGLVVLIIGFMMASGEYKRHYIDYLITEFYAEYGKK